MHRTGHWVVKRHGGIRGMGKGLPGVDKDKTSGS